MISSQSYGEFSSMSSEAVFKSNEDHSLANSDNYHVLYGTSPSQQSLYELDSVPLTCSFGDSQKDVLSSSLDDFDLKPQFEYSCVDMLRVEVGNETTMSQSDLTTQCNQDDWSPEMPLAPHANQVKMEEAFQVEQSHTPAGPTLAELNAEDSSSIFGDIEQIIGKDLHTADSGTSLSPAPMSNPAGETAASTTCHWRPHISTVPPSIAASTHIRQFAPHIITNSSNHIQTPSSPIGIPQKTITSPAHMEAKQSRTALNTHDIDMNSQDKDITAIITSSPLIANPYMMSQSYPDKPLAMYAFIGKMAALPEHSKAGLKSLLGEVAFNSSIPVPGMANFDTGQARKVPISTDRIKREVVGSSTLSCSAPPAVTFHSAQLSTLHQSVQAVPSLDVNDDLSPVSARYPYHTMDEKWEEIRQYIYDGTKNPIPTPHDRLSVKVPRKRNDSEVSFASTDTGLFTSTEDCDSDDDSDSQHRAVMSDEEMNYDESFWSDTEDVEDEAEEDALNRRKNTRFFWQYNTQSKGPKGKRLCKSFSNADPHVLNDFEDPVFDPDLNQSQYKHNGKARRGDGNDISPSPQKLLSIGLELKKLNCTINELTPVSELPVNVRPKSRKEKNKLASRACRLKKKAQHEANKVKLHGLDKEHQRLMTVLDAIKADLMNHVEASDVTDESLSIKLDRYIKKHLTHMIAGHTTEYVNTVLAKVKSGDNSGGIYI